MKKIFILVLMVLVGISLLFSNLRAEEARTIPYLSSYANAANKVVVAHGGTLHLITGFAGSANSNYSIHDSATAAAASDTNVLCEGGEATQYDSLTTIDFGEEGIPFVNGLVVITSTAKVAVLYK